VLLFKKNNVKTEHAGSSGARIRVINEIGREAIRPKK